MECPSLQSRRYSGSVLAIQAHGRIKLLNGSAAATRFG
jgi:hypothetical protein